MTKDKRIMHLCLACFYIDDYSYQENILPKYHKRMGNTVKIIASTVKFNNEGKLEATNKFSEYISSDGIEVVRLPYLVDNIVFRTLRIYRGLSHELVKFEPDIIFIHGGQFMDLNVVNKYLQKNKNVKVFIDNHADTINSSKSFISRVILHKCIWKSVIKRIETKVDKFYGVSSGRSKFLIDFYSINRNKVFTLPMGVDDDYQKKIYDKQSIRKECGITSDDFVFVTGGKFDKNKNVDVLINTFRDLDCNCKLIVFGVFDEDTIYLLDDLPANVKFVGWKNQDAIFDLLSISNCAIFLGTHSVLWEQIIGFGLPAILKVWEGFEHIYDVSSVVSLDKISKAVVQVVIKEVVTNYDEIYSKAKVNSQFFSYSDIALKSIEE